LTVDLRILCKTTALRFALERFALERFALERFALEIAAQFFPVCVVGQNEQGEYHESTPQPLPLR
jgi:hypothetical protein